MVIESNVRKHRVRVRFYQELGDFLAPHRRGREFELAVHDGTTTKALVEHCGVPHGEVDLLLVNGESVDFAHKLRDGQRVSVYPVFESFDIAALTRVRPVPLRAVRFLVDANLAKLASLLRMCGLDATDAGMLYRTAVGAAASLPRADQAGRPGEAAGVAEAAGVDRGRVDDEDARLVAVARCEQRIILTRDRRLLERKAVTHGCFVRSQDPEQQLLFVLRRFDLAAPCGRSPAACAATSRSSRWPRLTSCTACRRWCASSSKRSPAVPAARACTGPAATGSACAAASTPCSPPPTYFIARESLESLAGGVMSRPRMCYASWAHKES